jgi:hypothetical protein
VEVATRWGLTPSSSGTRSTAGAAIVALDQVVERAQEQDGIDRRVCEVEVAGIADRRADRGVTRLAQLVDVELHQVAVLHGVATPGQPRGVPTGSPADVGHDGRSRRQSPEQDLLGPFELQGTLGPRSRSRSLPCS